MKNKELYFTVALILDFDDIVDFMAKKLVVPPIKLHEVVKLLKKKPQENLHLVNELGLRISQTKVEQAIHNPEQIALTIVQEDPALGKQLCKIIIALGKRNIKAIKAKILSNHKILDVIGNILKACGKELEFQNLLKNLLESRNRTIKSIAASVAEKIFNKTKNKEIFESLKTLLKDSYENVKTTAVQAIGSIFENSGEFQVIDLLLRFLMYEIPSFRYRDTAVDIVVRAIFKIVKEDKNGNEMMLRAVEKLFTVDDSKVKEAATTIIGNLFRGTGNMNVLEFLMKQFTYYYTDKKIIEAIGNIFRGTGLEMKIVKKMFKFLDTDYLEACKKHYRCYFDSSTTTAIEKLKIKIIQELFKESGSIDALEFLKTFVRPLFISDETSGYDYDDNDFEIRGDLAVALGDVFKGTENAEVIDILKYILEDIEEDFYPAIDAAYAIFEVAPGLYDDYVLAQLKPFVTNPEESISVITIEAIGDLFEGTGDIKAFEAIMPCVLGCDYDINEIATEAVKKLFEGTSIKAKVRMLKALKHTLERNSYIDGNMSNIVEIIGDYFRNTADLRILEIIKLAFKQGNESTKISCVIAIADIFQKTCNKKVAKFLLKLLLKNYEDFEDEGYELKEYIIGSLEAIFDSNRCKMSFLVMIISFLKHKNEDIRALAISELGGYFRKTGDKKITKLLENHLIADSSDFVKENVITALGKIYEGTNNSYILNILKPYLSAQNAYLTLNTIHALVDVFKHTGNKQAFDLLMPFLTHTNHDLRFAARSAIEVIFKNSGLEENLLTLLEPLLFNKNDQYRWIAMEIIQYVFKGTGNPKVLEVLKRLLKDTFKGTYSLIAEVIDDVFGETDDENLINDAVEMLKILLRDKNPHVRIKAIEAIERLFQGRSNKALLNLLKPYFNDENLDKTTLLNIICWLFDGSGDNEAYEIAKSILPQIDSYERWDLEKKIDRIKFRA